MVWDLNFCALVAWTVALFVFLECQKLKKAARAGDASVRARAPARKRPFDVEAPSLTRNRRPIDAHASKRHFPFVRGGRLAVSLDSCTVTRFAPGPIYNDSTRGLVRLEELDVALVGRAAVARNGVVRSFDLCGNQTFG